MCTERGYSLVELSVTMAVVALLSVVAIPILQTYATRSSNEQVRNQILHFSLVAEEHYLKNSSYKGMAVGGADTGEQAIWQLGIQGFSFNLTQANQNSYELEVLQQGQTLALFRSNGERGFDFDGDGIIRGEEMHW